MFQALFFQERAAVADIRAHEKEAATKKKPVVMPRSPKLGPRRSSRSDLRKIYSNLEDATKQDTKKQ